MGIAPNGTTKIFQIISISALLLIAGVLVSTGRVLSTVDQNTRTLEQVREQIRDLRGEIHSDVARDMAYVESRLNRIEKYIDGRAE